MNRHECDGYRPVHDGYQRIEFMPGCLRHQHVDLWRGWPVVQGEVIRRHNGPRRGPSHARTTR